MESVRLLIVDDHADVRRALRRLATLENWHVYGEAADGLEGIQATRLFRPEVILMDLFMPHMTGLQAADEIRQEFPATLIMLVTTTDASTEQAARNVGIAAPR